MGSYATTDELKTRFENEAEVESLTDKPEGSGPDDAVLTEIIDNAEGEINSALSVRYLTPVDVSVDTSLAALLKAKTLDLAEYQLQRRGEAASEVKQLQAERVIEWLDKIIKPQPERNLVGAVTVPSTASNNPRGSWSSSNRELKDSSARYFTRDTQGRL